MLRFWVADLIWELNTGFGICMQVSLVAHSTLFLTFNLVGSEAHLAFNLAGFI
jgi:hypothetical protein